MRKISFRDGFFSLFFNSVRPFSGGNHDNFEIREQFT